MLWLNQVGAWRSPVAHLHGVQGAVGSNPIAPTIYLDINWWDNIIFLDVEDINGKIGQIAKEMQIFAKKDEVKTLQKYVTMWEPIKFVTENQVEEIVKEIISKK